MRIFHWPIPFCIRMAHYSRGKAGWWSTVNTSLSPMQLASGCTWIWFVDSIPVLVGFLRVLRFPPTSKNRTSFHYFLVIVPVRCVVGVCKRPRIPSCVSAAADTQQRLETYGWLARRINTLHYYYCEQRLLQNWGKIQFYLAKILLSQK